MAPDFNAPMEFIEVDGEMVLVPEDRVLARKRLKSQNLPGRERDLKKIRKSSANAAVL
jgi:hypothetical protein